MNIEMNVISTIYDSRFSITRKYFFQDEIEISIVISTIVRFTVNNSKESVYFFFFFKKFFYIEKLKLTNENVMLYCKSKIKDYLHQNFA